MIGIMAANSMPITPSSSHPTKLNRNMLLAERANKLNMFEFLRNMVCVMHEIDRQIMALYNRWSSCN